MQSSDMLHAVSRRPIEGMMRTMSVPDLSAFASVAEMKAALAHAGLTGAFGSRGKPPTQDLEYKTTGALDPPAGSKVPKGSTVSVSIYQCVF